MRPGASASSGQARLRGPAQEPPPPPRTPGAGRGDSILLFTLGTRIFGVYFLSLQKNGSLAFQITPFYLETLESQDLCVAFIWRKETTWFCLFSLFAFAYGRTDCPLAIRRSYEMTTARFPQSSC